MVKIGRTGGVTKSYMDSRRKGIS